MYYCYQLCRRKIERLLRGQSRDENEYMFHAVGMYVYRETNHCSESYLFEKFT